ncbi:MAG: four helix bundle protein [Sedimentisphaerales bacterium]
MAYQSYKDLEIYKKAHKLAIEIHEMSLHLPRFEMYEGGSQIRKSSKSVKDTIVEGFGRRRYKHEFIKYLTYSLSSCDETVSHLHTLYDTKSLEDEEKYQYFYKEYDCLGKMINNFMKSVNSGHKTRIENPESSIQNLVSRI